MMKDNFKKNDLVTLEITDLGSSGEGIGKVDGFTLFVKDDVIDICYKKQYSRRVYSHSSYKINSFRWEKATKFINMGKLRYESSENIHRLSP